MNKMIEKLKIEDLGQCISESENSRTYCFTNVNIKMFDKINEIIDYLPKIHTKIDHKIKNLQNEIRQNQASWDKKGNNISKIWVDEYSNNKQSKLDEARSESEKINRYEDTDKIKQLYESAINEIIQQKDEELEESNGAFESLLKERNTLLDIEINLNDKIRQLEKENKNSQELLKIATNEMLQVNDLLKYVCDNFEESYNVNKYEFIKEKLKQQKPKIDDDAICKIVMGICQIYEKYMIGFPYIQEDHSIKLLEGDYIIIRRILEKHLGVPE